MKGITKEVDGCKTQKTQAKKTVFLAVYKVQLTVGATNTLVDFIVFWLLTHAGMNYMLSQVFSYSAGILNSYIWNSKWTFKKERSHSLKTVLMFILVNVLSLGVSLGVLWVCKNPIGINQDVAVNIFGKAISISSDLICKIPASVFSAVANFVLTKLFVFNKETHPEENGGN